MKRAVLLYVVAMWATALSAAEELGAVFGGAERVTLIDRAQRVEACILRVEDPSGGRDLKQRRFAEGRYKALSDGVTALLIWKLLDRDSYTWDAVPACIPVYNARVRFSSDDRVIEVDFCFSCSIIRVAEDGKTVGGGYFNPGSDWIFQAVASEFPRDPIIRKLKKERDQRAKIRFEIEMARAVQARKVGLTSQSPNAGALTRPSAGDL